MPRGNRTGPMGMGPMTGHRGGYCVGPLVGVAAEDSAGAGGTGFMKPGHPVGQHPIMHQTGLFPHRKSRNPNR